MMLEDNESSTSDSVKKRPDNVVEQQPDVVESLIYGCEL